MPTLDLPSLVDDLDQLAIETWKSVYIGPQLGLALREESITETNLLKLRLKHPALHVRKFSTTEEAGNGADWEWWIGSDADGWLGVRIQAKKQRDASYPELDYRAKSQSRIQCQVLIEETLTQASGRALFPYYCFYNGWEPQAWPPGVAWTIECRKPANCKYVPDIRVFGCALAPAAEVLNVLLTDSRPLEMNATLPLQRPWSWLLSKPQSAAFRTANDVLTAMVARQNVERPELFTELPTYATAVRQRWRPGQLAEIASDVPTTFVLVSDLGGSDDEQ